MMPASLRNALRRMIPARARWFLRTYAAPSAWKTLRLAWRVRVAAPPGSESGHSGVVIPAQFNAALPTLLCAMMRHAGSDKGMGWHNYTTLYHALFRWRRFAVRRVFEMGLGTNDPSKASTMGSLGVPGASLRAWREYFPNAWVFGADIEPGTLFTEDRIRTWQCDQTDPAALAGLWGGHPELAEPFDLIIDDGLHEPRANRCFFEHSCGRLTVGGLFIIEDIDGRALPIWETDILASWRRDHPGFRFALVRIPHPRNMADNNLLLALRVAPEAP